MSTPLYKELCFPQHHCRHTR